VTREPDSLGDSGASVASVGLAVEVDASSLGDAEAEEELLAGGVADSLAGSLAGSLGEPVDSGAEGDPGSDGDSVGDGLDEGVDGGSVGGVGRRSSSSAIEALPSASGRSTNRHR